MTRGGANADSPNDSAGVLRRRLEAVVVVAVIVLTLATWPLWWGVPKFPAVPLFSSFVTTPRWADALALALAALGLTSVAAGFAWPAVRAQAADADGPAIRHSEMLRSVGWSIFLVAEAALVSLDQHRWQPWLWEYGLFAALFLTAPPSRLASFARALVLGIYVHSAVSKLDASFLHTHGPQLVDGFLANFRTALPPRGATRTAAAVLLPCGELLAAALLAIRPTRRIGLATSVAMHLALIAALGPWGLQHHPGVLLWNAFFIGQNVLLFGRTEPPPTIAHPTGGSFRLACATIVAGLGVLLPVAEWFDRIDPWLGWSVYASRPARLRLFVDESAVPRLPDELVPFVEPAAPLDPWRRVRIDRWSLESTAAPISPQLRFQTGVVLAILPPLENEAAVRLEADSPANRRTERRTTRILNGAAAIRAFAAEFRSNAVPRGGFLSARSSDPPLKELDKSARTAP